ncbi:hypothetical protein [Mycolicibacterium aubagnense]|uniref:Uncharacterized protein n=1 Tax=Mycolicibacterium aubagnense TaxID=319707 RepID=A0ABN5YKK8_9MYCO|nr:hypothetical protein [Mycolicibacterium aubagnense]TLH48995.1 hypothetical protein C1S80_29380 [Mycolicibacterium aubagnense]BBX82216.1 hypothetical protein MAUB_00890 [Mycolicibacterium aubagnense]
MTVVIDNHSFVKGLAAAKVMAYAGADDPTHAAVVLASTRVETDGPGTQNSLAFIASDGASPGQAIFACDGELKPVKFSTDQAAQLLAAAKGAVSAVRKTDKEAECGVELSVVDGGATLRMRTLTDGHPGDADSRHFIPLQDIEDFPMVSTISRLSARGAKEVLGSRGQGDEQVNAPLNSGNVQSFTADVIKKMSAIAAVFKEPVELYTREHPASLVTLTCAGVFRAVLAAHAYSPDLDVTDPEVPVAESLIGDDSGAGADAA